MLRFWNSFRSRLFILVILGVMPSLAIVLHSAFEQRRVAAEYAQESVLRLASDVSKDQHLMIEMTRKMLADLADDPVAKNLDLTACSGMFNKYFGRRPFLFYSNIGIVDLQGNLVCSTVSGTHPVNVADRSYFQQTIQTRSFSVGSFQIGKLSGQKTVNFGYPVIGDDGQIRAVLVAALDLSWFNELAAAADLPKNASLTFIDNNGIILSRYPDPEKWVGRAAPETDVIKKVLQQRQGVAEAVGIDGIPKLYGFKPLGRAPQGGFVYVGFPKEPVFAKADQMLSSNLLIVAVTGALGLIAVWAFGYLFVMRGVNALVSASRQIAAGNLGARTGLGSAVNGEIGGLASVFDDMAESLQKREAEQKFARDSLKAARDFSEMIIESLPGTFYVFDKRGKFLRWNHNFETISGYSAAEIPTLSPTDFFAEEHKRTIQEAVKHVFEKGEAIIQVDVLSKGGKRTPFLLTGRLGTHQWKQLRGRNGTRYRGTEKA